MINIPILHLKIPLIYFQLFLGLVLGIAMIIFSFVLVVLLLDSVYRKDAKQYPKHFIWDTLAPLILLFIPSILILSIKSDTLTIMDKFFLLICIHGFLLIPLMYLWSKHRRWDHITDAPLNSWSHSRIYLRIAVALIYPALFGFYYSILRYLRMGQTVDIYQVFNAINLQDILSYLILSLFIWPFISLWLKIFFWLIKDLRIFLWDEFLFLINFSNIFLLKSNMYFRIMEIFYKISYIWISYVIHDPLVYPKWPRSYFRDFLFKLYRLPIIIYLILALCCLLEVIYFKGKLFYMLYIVMVLLLIRPLIYFLNHFNGEENQWVQACCYSDYIEGRWDKPRYPERFWLSFIDIRLRLNNLPIMSDTLQEHIKMRINFIQDKVKRNRLKILDRAYKLSTRKNISRMHLIRGGYYQWAQIRWVHTSKVVNTIEPVVNKIWHPSLQYNINVQTYKKHLKLDTAAQAEPDLSFDMSKNTMFLDKRV